MSCTCKSSYYNIPCCCPNTITTTTTTIVDDTICSEVYGSSSIFYPYIDNTGCLDLPVNANLTEILVAIMQTFPQCTTTTSTTSTTSTTTTTTTAGPIYCDDGGGCPIGYTCIDGICESVGCEVSGDCPIGFICINGTCIPDACDEYGNCPSGYICVDGTCEPNTCNTTVDCPSGYTCVNGICTPTTTTTSTTTAAPNSPCNAYSLQVTADCTYQTYNNLNSNGNFNVPPSPCGNYLGGDVWFSMIVPSSGEIVISLQAGTITDAAMSIYLGTCNSLVEIECVDDVAGNQMPQATLTGLTPGATVFIRVWSYGNQQTGTFSICSINPVLNPCNITGTAANVLCLTTTTTTAAIHLPECAPLYIASYSNIVGDTIQRGTNIYYYNVSTNTSTLLPVPGLGANAKRYLDLAHTSNKLWLCDPPNNSFVEYDISLSPWTAIYNRTITYPSNFKSSAGLHAISNNTLLTVNTYNYIIDPTVNPAVVTEFDVNTNTLTPKFSLLVGRSAFGDFMLTTNNKFIITTQDNVTGDVYISQYNYLTYTLEFDLLISATVPGPAITRPYGMFESGNNIYLLDSHTGVYLINKTAPYTRTFIGIPIGGNFGDSIFGGSQLSNCITGSFTPNITTTTTTSTTSTTTTSTTSTTSTTTTTTSNIPTTTSTTTTTTAGPGIITWQVNGNVGGNLQIVQDPSSIMVNQNSSTGNSYSGIVSSDGGTTDYTATINWVTGSGNTIRIRICDVVTGTEIDYYQIVGNTPGTYSYSFSINNGDHYNVQMTVGASNYPELCSTLNCAIEWSTENLNVTTYANGDPIPEVSNSIAWAALTTGAWCWYANNSANGPIYGRLYNHYALTDPRGLNIPAGYRLPTSVDWTTLKNCVNNISAYLKNTTGWAAGTYGNGNNATGFSALPGGIRNGIGGFTSVGGNGYWWALDGGTYVFMGTNFSTISTNSGADLRTGLSVRLIKI